MSRNLQDLEIIESVSCKLREGLNGSIAANAPVRRFVSLPLGGAPQPQARAGAAVRCDGLVRDRALAFRALCEHGRQTDAAAQAGGGASVSAARQRLFRRDSPVTVR